LQVERRLGLEARRGVAGERRLLLLLLAGGRGKGRGRGRGKGWVRRWEEREERGGKGRNGAERNKGFAIKSSDA